MSLPHYVLPRMVNVIKSKGTELCNNWYLSGYFMQGLAASQFQCIFPFLFV